MALSTPLQFLPRTIIMEHYGDVCKIDVSGCVDTSSFTDSTLCLHVFSVSALMVFRANICLGCAWGFQTQENQQLDNGRFTHQSIKVLTSCCRHQTASTSSSENKYVPFKNENGCDMSFRGSCDALQKHLRLHL